MDFLKKLKDVFVTHVDDTSAPKALDSTDTAKLVRDAVLAGAAASVAVLVDRFGELNLGDYTAYVGPVVLLVLQGVQKYLKGK